MKETAGKLCTKPVSKLLPLLTSYAARDSVHDCFWTSDTDIWQGV